MYYFFHMYYCVLAKEFVKCHTSDLAFDECVRSGLQSAIPQLAMGNYIVVLYI